MGRPALVHLDQIVDLAARSGPDFTVSEIAEQLGVDDSTLYRHITNRAELQRLVAARRYEQVEVAAPGIAMWDDYLVTVGERTRRMLGHHPDLATYLLRGPYTDRTLAVFRAYCREIVQRRPGLDERTAALVGSRVVCLTAAFSTAGILHDRNADSDTVFGWTLRSLIAGMGQLLDDGDEPDRSDSAIT